MAAENLKNVKIGFIGAGNMAKAIGGGLIKNGVVDKSQIFVNAPTSRNFEWWNDIGVSWVDKPRTIALNCDIIFLAMKPQTFANAMDNIGNISITLAEDEKHGDKHPAKLWVSILAGTTLETLGNRLIPVYNTSVYPIPSIPAIIRVMPNTPMTIGQGCSVYCGNSLVTKSDLDRVNTMLGSLGKTFEVKEEMIDSISSLMGSSPAYMYIIIEAMSDVGVKMGVPRDLAIQLSAQAMAGAAQMVLETGRHPGVLKDEVCSPGGSTIVGLHVLEQRGLRGAVMDTLEVVAAKNKELGRLASGR